LTSEGKTAVVDCGGDSSGNAGDLAAEYLAGIGDTRVDALILTHYHDDHANGAMELMQRVKVAKLIAPVPAEDDAFGNTIVAYALGCGAEVELIGKNSAIWQFGAAECRIIPPLGGKNENEQGLTVLCSSGKFDMLITGDMSDDSEYRLIEYTRLPKLELLMAGHHGSKNSTSRKLLEATEPETVIISVGHNAYGHPATETLERIQSIGAEVYRTDQNGTIVVKLGDEEKHNG